MSLLLMCSVKTLLCMDAAVDVKTNNDKEIEMSSAIRTVAALEQAVQQKRYTTKKMIEDGLVMPQAIAEYMIHRDLGLTKLDPQDSFFFCWWKCNEDTTQQERIQLFEGYRNNYRSFYNELTEIIIQKIEENTSLTQTNLHSELDKARKAFFNKTEEERVSNKKCLGIVRISALLFVITCAVLLGGSSSAIYVCSPHY